MTLDELRIEVMKLSKAERERLADELYFSIDASVDPEIDAAWRKEVADRSAAYERGEMDAAPVNEVLDELEREARRAKSA
jgi:putative addiction module component (TIGR02574 family)